MYDAERLIALGQRLHDDPETDDVGKLLEADRFPLHLAPDRVGAFPTTADLCGNAPVPELLRELLFDLLHEPMTARFERIEPLDDNLVGLRIELAEGEILKLLAHLMHAHAAGERSIDVDRFFRRAPARGRRHVLDRAHVV